MAKPKYNSVAYLPLFVNDWLTSQDVMTMSSAARGCYVMLLTHQWKTGVLPTDPAKLARLCYETQEAFEPIWREITHLFQADRETAGLYNPKLREIRESRFSKAGVFEDRARKAAAGRWGTTPPTNSTEAADQRNALRRALRENDEMPEPIWHRLVELCGGACVKCKRAPLRAVDAKSNAKTDAPRIAQNAFLVDAASIDKHRLASTTNQKIGEISLTQSLILPPSAGGRRTVENLQPLCRNCASTRGRDRADYRDPAVIQTLYEEFPFLRSVRRDVLADASSTPDNIQDNTTHTPPIVPQLDESAVDASSTMDFRRPAPLDDHLIDDDELPQTSNRTAIPSDVLAIVDRALAIAVDAGALSPAWVLMHGDRWKREQIHATQALLASYSADEIVSRLRIAAEFIASGRARQPWTIAFVVESWMWQPTQRANTRGARGARSVDIDTDYDAMVIVGDNLRQAEGG